MSILSLCDNGDVLSVFRIVNIVIMIIKIAVPILLIVTGMITLMKTINVCLPKLRNSLLIIV
ncbi:MAG: hypothetical protein MSH48_01210 [Mollicutes bacterium]|nr:hypothetical protein [Mollicutes bacterium]